MSKVKKVTAVALVGLVVAAAVAAPVSAAPVGGSKIGGQCVIGGGAVTYYQTAWGAEEMLVSVDGDNSTLLTVYVYDQNGALIISDTGYNPSVVVLPYFTQQVKIVVVNHGLRHNCYNIVLV